MIAYLLSKRLNSIYGSYWATLSIHCIHKKNKPLVIFNLQQINHVSGLYLSDFITLKAKLKLHNTINAKVEKQIDQN
jgi:hypothetical protein